MMMIRILLLMAPMCMCLVPRTTILRTYLLVCLPLMDPQGEPDWFDDDDDLDEDDEDSDDEDSDDEEEDEEEVLPERTVSQSCICSSFRAPPFNDDLLLFYVDYLKDNIW